MEEIKLGEYCRTDTGEIYIMKYFIKEFDYSKIKHSFNIIDLIEVGDYVNGYKVSLISKDIEKFVQCDYPVQEGTTNHYKFYNKAIKSIITKEQFAAVEYKLDN